MKNEITFHRYRLKSYTSLEVFDLHHEKREIRLPRGTLVSVMLKKTITGKKSRVTSLILFVLVEGEYLPYTRKFIRNLNEKGEYIYTDTSNPFTSVEVKEAISVLDHIYTDKIVTIREDDIFRDENQRGLLLTNKGQSRK